jgi:2-polyprenyl-3-methyl-5-hydroxy-6-metoxy-1,4-benzoquinol methylase
MPSEASRIRVLEERVRVLEAEREKKELVIRELDQAARERLAMINRLTRSREPDAVPDADTTNPTGHRAGPGLAHFHSLHYRDHNRARLDHLESLGLPLANGRVLELGSGPGDHTGFYVERGCAVVSADARQECLDVLAERFPGVRTVQCDLNEPDHLLDFGTFDVVHCFGILYHLEKPEPLLRYMGEVCTGIAIVETCVSAARTSAVEPADEVREDYTQSVTGVACRPTRQWVFETLGRYFPFVYHTKTQPAHAEFPTDWNDLSGAPPLIRSVFVASKRPLELPTLSPTLLDVQMRVGE